MKFVSVCLATANPCRTKVVAKKVEAALDPADECLGMLPEVGNDKNDALNLPTLLR